MSINTTAFPDDVYEVRGFLKNGNSNDIIARRFSNGKIMVRKTVRYPARLKDPLAAVKKELQAWMSINDEKYIVNLSDDSFWIARSLTLSIHIEFPAGGTLQQMMEEFCREKKSIHPIVGIYWALEITRALWTCHEAGIYHRDFNPMAVFLSKPYDLKTNDILWKASNGEILDISSRAAADEFLKWMDLENKPAWCKVTGAGFVRNLKHDWKDIKISETPAPPTEITVETSNIFRLGCLIYKLCNSMDSAITPSDFRDGSLSLPPHYPPAMHDLVKNCLVTEIPKLPKLKIFLSELNDIWLDVVKGNLWEMTKRGLQNTIPPELARSQISSDIDTSSILTTSDLKSRLSTETRATDSGGAVVDTFLLSNKTPTIGNTIDLTRLEPSRPRKKVIEDLGKWHILSSQSPEHIVKISSDWMALPYTDRFTFYKDFYEGGSLQDVISACRASKVAIHPLMAIKLSLEIAKAVSVLHRKDLVPGKLVAGNIVLCKPYTFNDMLWRLSSGEELNSCIGPAARKWLSARLREDRWCYFDPTRTIFDDPESGVEEFLSEELSLDALDALECLPVESLTKEPVVSREANIYRVGCLINTLWDQSSDNGKVSTNGSILGLFLKLSGYTRRMETLIDSCRATIPEKRPKIDELVYDLHRIFTDIMSVERKFWSDTESSHTATINNRQKGKSRQLMDELAPARVFDFWTKANNASKKPRSSKRARALPRALKTTVQARAELKQVLGKSGPYIPEPQTLNAMEKRRSESSTSDSYDWSFPQLSGRKKIKISAKQELEFVIPIEIPRRVLSCNKREYEELAPDYMMELLTRQQRKCKTRIRRLPTMFEQDEDDEWIIHEEDIY